LSDGTDKQETAPAKRGEAAWKEQRDAIAARNEQARKASRQRRGVEDRVRAQARRAAEGREMAEALHQHDGK
jgi:hypothetical protein